MFMNEENRLQPIFLHSCFFDRYFFLSTLESCTGLLMTDHNPKRFFGANQKPLSDPEPNSGSGEVRVKLGQQAQCGILIHIILKSHCCHYRAF